MRNPGTTTYPAELSGSDEGCRPTMVAAWPIRSRTRKSVSEAFLDVVGRDRPGPRSWRRSSRAICRATWQSWIKSSMQSPACSATLWTTFCRVFDPATMLSTTRSQGAPNIVSSVGSRHPLV